MAWGWCCREDLLIQRGAILVPWSWDLPDHHAPPWEHLGLHSCWQQRCVHATQPQPGVFYGRFLSFSNIGVFSMFPSQITELGHSCGWCQTTMSMALCLTIWTATPWLLKEWSNWLCPLPAALHICTWKYLEHKVSFVKVKSTCSVPSSPAGGYNYGWDMLVCLLRKARHRPQRSQVQEHPGEEELHLCYCRPGIGCTTWLRHWHHRHRTQSEGGHQEVCVHLLCVNIKQQFSGKKTQKSIDFLSIFSLDYIVFVVLFTVAKLGYILKKTKFFQRFNCHNKTPHYKTSC